MPTKTRKIAASTTETAPAQDRDAPAPAAVRKTAAKKPAARKTAETKAGASAAAKASVGPVALPAAGNARTAPASAPAPALKALAALGVDEGVFVLVAAPATLEPLESFARYADEPLPHLVPAGEGAWLRSQPMAGAVVYVAFVPWPQPPAGALKLGCVTASGRKPVFGVDCIRVGTAAPASVAALLKRYAKLLVPAVEAVLPAGHVLRRALAPAAKPAAVAAAAARPAVPAKSQPAVTGHFDGVVDEQAHGWVFAPAQPGRRLTVEVLCGDEVVGRGTADRYREDLQANGVGDGEHHFRLVLSYELFDGEPHELRVRVAETGTLLPERVVATLPKREPGDFDLMPRAQVLAAGRELADKLKVREPKALEALLQALRTASLQQETGETAAARGGYERLIKALGPNALCQCRIAETWLTEGSAVLACAAYEGAVETDGAFAWAHLGLGNALQLQGRLLQAQTSYQAALTRAPGMVPAMARSAQVAGDAAVLKAQHLVDAGSIEQAVLLLTKALIDRPADSSVMRQLDELIQRSAPKEQFYQDRLPEDVKSALCSKRLLDAVMNSVESRLAAKVIE